ncbi:GNAT family N-acetyltransferase [Clostridium frigidicarnis]|uniref:Acetyltransferase (GNAT) domain-containing protein n=1 Tax=Clostridium frigidicarnis TaxID=84698 RepID=A0A1I1AW47_9CLOT|nr:GNAT family N-acetyltransferase [Clostridium frigidicarnis]SFB40560.1 Acetyltransferase (GNAT) domain-containing protein [Clostridium frigidicarnis]
MIRDYRKSDIDEIVKIYTLEYKAMPEEIENLKSASKILVYDDNGIQGFIRLAMSSQYCYAEMGVVSNELIKPVGLKLWEAAKKLLVEKSINFVEIFHVKDNLEWQNLYNEIGFEYWYSVYRFTYDGNKFNEPNICAVKYEDKYYEDKIRLESEAFSVLRRENDIKPYNWYLNASREELEANRKGILEDKEYIYLFFEENEMVGASMVKNAEIDLLFVNIKFQGKGYGKKILEFTMNRGLEQNATAVNLNALAKNEKALKLYKNVGFRIVQAQDARRLIIK